MRLANSHISSTYLPTGNDFYKAFMAELGITVEGSPKTTEEPTSTYSLPIEVIQHMKLACQHCPTEKEARERFSLSTRSQNMRHVRLEITVGYAQVIASNGYMLYMSSPCEVGGKEPIALNIPVAIIKQLALATCQLEVWHRASGDHEYRIGGNLVKDVPHEYPDWQAVVPTIDENIEVEVAVLKPAITQALLKTNDCLKKEGKHAKVTPTVLQINGGILRLTTTFAEDGTATVSEVKYIVNNTDRTTISASAVFLDRAMKTLDLRTVKTIKIHVSTRKEMLIFKTPTQSVLVMGIVT